MHGRHLAAEDLARLRRRKSKPRDSPWWTGVPEMALMRALGGGGGLDKATTFFHLASEAPPRRGCGTRQAGLVHFGLARALTASRGVQVSAGHGYGRAWFSGRRGPTSGVTTMFSPCSTLGLLRLTFGDPLEGLRRKRGGVGGGMGGVGPGSSTDAEAGCSRIGGQRCKLD